MYSITWPTPLVLFALVISWVGPLFYLGGKYFLMGFLYVSLAWWCVSDVSTSSSEGLWVSAYVAKGKCSYHNWPEPVWLISGAWAHWNYQWGFIIKKEKGMTSTYASTISIFWAPQDATWPLSYGHSQLAGNELWPMLNQSVPSCYDFTCFFFLPIMILVENPRISSSSF
jgi:hypothetical protein